MKLLHCLKCHHEWEGHEGDTCAWCGANSRVMEEETPLTQFAREFHKRLTEDD